MIYVHMSLALVFRITHTSWCVRRGCGSDEGDLILGLCRCRSLEMRLWQRCRLSETSDMVCVVVTTWNNLNQQGGVPVLPKDLFSSLVHFLLVFGFVT